MIVIYILLGLWAIFEFSAHLNCGTNKSSVNKIIETLENKNVRINQYDYNIFYIEGFSPYIATQPFSLLAKYYVNNLGLVYRWTKAHKVLQNLHNKALLNQ